jgi:hypothetical protein
MTEKKSPQRVLETKADQLSFGIDFHPLDGRIYGFVYAHLLSYPAEKIPLPSSSPTPPPTGSAWRFQPMMSSFWAGA